MFKYLHDGKYHTDISVPYMVKLGVNEDTQQAIINQRAYEESQYTAKREEAYKKESDHLYMEAQFDGTPESLQLWRDKVSGIKAKYPKTTL